MQKNTEMFNNKSKITGIPVNWDIVPNDNISQYAFLIPVFTVCISGIFS